MFGLSLGGAQQWARALGGSDDPFMQQQRQPATGSDGSLYLTGMGGANGWSLYRVDPASGNVLWNYSPFPSNGMSAPSVGPDGSVYFSRSLSYLESVTPAGQSRWTFSDGSIIDHPAVSPDGSVVVAGVRPNFGQPGSVRAWNAATGDGRLADRPAQRERRQPDPVHAATLLGRQPDRLLRHRHPRRAASEYSFLYAVGPGTAAAAATTARRPAQCVVPGVVGLTLARPERRSSPPAARSERSARVRSKQVGIVLAQSPAAGTTLPQGGRVNLTVGRR